MLIAQAEALAEAEDNAPFAGLESILNHAPDWIAGHTALARLKREFSFPDPLRQLEQALAKLGLHPSLWHAYLTLLAAEGHHAEAADKAAELRRKVGDVPELRLLEARYSGLAGDPERGAKLLAGLRHDVPDIDYQRARNALQRGAVEDALSVLKNAPEPRDMRIWAMRELCWRATDDPQHSALLQNGALVASFDLGLSETELAACIAHLRTLHTTRQAPPSQSLRRGTQTRGALHKRDAPWIEELFWHFTAALADYATLTAELPKNHPLSALIHRPGQIRNSWSVRLSSGGHHVLHLHDSGLISSACHLVVPDMAVENEGALELGRPPADMAIALEPFATIQPAPGTLILFPSFLYHGTTPFASGERLSVVIDAD